VRSTNWPERGLSAAVVGEVVVQSREGGGGGGVVWVSWFGRRPRSSRPPCASIVVRTWLGRRPKPLRDLASNVNFVSAIVVPFVRWATVALLFGTGLRIRLIDELDEPGIVTPDPGPPDSWCTWPKNRLAHLRLETHHSVRGLVR
jgi:hypothetical protein